MFVCILDASKVGLINNTITSINLPKTHRAFVSMHHICGTKTPTDGTTANDCEFQAGIYTLLNAATGEFKTDMFFDMPSNLMVNDGTLNTVQDWFYSNIKLPYTKMGQRLRFLASFDTKNGGFGLDNVHLHTPQM